MNNIRVGSRESKLAVAQSELVMQAIRRADPTLNTRLITMKTMGDQILDRTLDQIGGKGLFVKELDRALLEGQIDLAVHSLKDMPMEQDARLPIVAYSRRADPRDVLILPLGVKTLDESKPIGCSSARRAMQLQKLYPGVLVRPVRGNVQTRLAKLDSGEFSALVLAHAGISRLGLKERISRVFSVEEMLPAAGQGILAVQGRAGDDYSELLSRVDDADARHAALAERAFVRALDGGCSAPTAAYAVVDETRLRLTGFCEDTAEPYGFRLDTIEGNRSRAELLGETLAARMKQKRGPGKVWLVGAGPGDEGLMTLKGRAALEQADVVVYDALVGAEILAMIPPEALRIDAGKRAGAHTMPQEEISRTLLEQALAGRRVVRLKGGDPFLFGRGGEEAELLAQRGIAFEVVPGVTSALAAPAYAGIPVTHRDFSSAVHIITVRQKDGAGFLGEIKAAAGLEGTLVFLMGVAALPKLCAGLIAAGMRSDRPAALIERGTTARQRVTLGTLADLPALTKDARAPGIIVVGEVCALARTLSWSEKRPLDGRRLVVTRPRARGGRLAALLRERGAQVIELPSVRTTPIDPNPPLDDLLERLPDYGWLVFTSPAGVETFFALLHARRRDVRSLGGIRLAAIGAATARALEERGLFCDLVPDRYCAAALGEQLAKAAHGGRVLLARARDGSPALTEALEKAGIEFTDLALYETDDAKEDAGQVRLLLQQGEIDALAFTSASTVHGFARSMGADVCLKGARAVCIGEATAQAAAEYGMDTTVAPQATIPDMVNTMIQLYAGGKQDE